MHTSYAEPPLTRHPHLHDGVTVNDLYTLGVEGGRVMQQKACAKFSKSVLPFILFGLFLLAVYAIVLVTGYAPLRYSSGVSLSEQPVLFWLASSIYLVGGLIMLAVGLWRMTRR